MDIPNIWSENDLQRLRWFTIQDVTFLAADAKKQQRIERFATESWAVVDYESEDGPFRTINTTPTKLSPSALKGNITLSADRPVFTSGNVGSLFKITSVGQQVDADITGADQWTDSIRVTGIDTGRVFDILVSSISTDITVRIQRSIGEEGSWADVSGLSYTSTVDTTYDDGQDTQISAELRQIGRAHV